MAVIKKAKKTRQKVNFYEVIGWVGVVMGLSAYTLIVFRVVDGSNMWYLWLNILGSIFLVIESKKKSDWQAVVINGVIGCFALINLLRLFV